MLSKTHVIIGLSYAAGLVPAVAHQQLTPVGFSCTVMGLVVGSLLPDLDHPQAAINRHIPLFGAILGRLFGHRGMLHSLVGVLGWMLLTSIAGAALAVAWPDAREAAAHVFAGLLVGYILHILADSFTKNGVRLLYPLPFHIGFRLIRTGGISETVIRWALIGLTVLNVLSVVVLPL